MAAVKRLYERLWQPANFSPNDGKSARDAPNATLHNDDYKSKVDVIRSTEYPSLMGTTYLDHAGTTLYAKSAIESWTTELTNNLFGNPHSSSASSQLSTRRIDDIRLRILKFFNASPEDFDVVFVANATAAIKLVAECFRDDPAGFWYGYHADSHTSLVGCRELATLGTRCFQDDHNMQSWISGTDGQDMHGDHLQLIAYPGQSNMTGRRLRLSWSNEVRVKAEATGRRIFTLLDAASLVSTSPLDLSNALRAPDFIALSFYKIFGFPDLGGLIVRKESASVLMQKRYFAGGTVDAVATSQTDWHAKKAILHSALEEGTLPFHNIIALDHAMDAHARLFGSMQQVSSHVSHLRNKVRDYLVHARHANGEAVCEVYEEVQDVQYGPLLAFNLRDSSGRIISASEVEKLCIVKGIQLRTGGLCNPGGVARHLQIHHEQIRSNYNAGYRCGGESDIINSRPTGVIRISFGAMSTRRDLQNFINFVEEYFVDRGILAAAPTSPRSNTPEFFVESLAVFPIKSCAAVQIPPDQKWSVTHKGLAWDREWCLVHEGTNVALSQKKYPRMALLQPELDLVLRKLIIKAQVDGGSRKIEIDLDEMPLTTPMPAKTCSNDAFALRTSKVCGDAISLHVYRLSATNDFFSEALGVPCCLARYPPSGQVRQVTIRQPFGGTSPLGIGGASQIMLANESPMLTVSRSSVNELNRQIEHYARDQTSTNTPVVPMVSASSFRANIVLAERDNGSPFPYDEDHWKSISITKEADISPSSSLSSSRIPQSSSSTQSNSRPGSSATSSTDAEEVTTSSRTSISSEIPPTSKSELTLNILGPCQRCQMVGINQTTALPQQEPFSTLVKTRRKGDGRVWFGVHAALHTSDDGSNKEKYIQVGNVVMPSRG